MKKMLALVLAVILVMSMAVPAAALASPNAKSEDLKPVLTKKSETVIEIHTTEEVLELSEAVQKVMAEAKKALKDACPANYAVHYFCYVEIIGDDHSVHMDIETIESFADKEVLDALLGENRDSGRLVVMQFVDGKWVELEFTINKDGTITILGVVEGPIAFFVKHD